MASNWCTLHSSLLNHIDGNERWFDGDTMWILLIQIRWDHLSLQCTTFKIELSVSFLVHRFSFSSLFILTYAVLFQDVDSSWICLKFCKTGTSFKSFKIRNFFSSSFCLQNMKSQWCSQVKSTEQSIEAFNQSRKIKNYFNWVRLWQNNIVTQTIEKCLRFFLFRCIVD